MRWNLSWSADGRRVAASHAWRAYTVDKESGRQTPIGPQDAYVATPAFSPDGEHLVYSVYDREEREWELVLAEADGSDPQPMGTRGRAPVWSPDGERFAYLGFSDRVTSRLALAEEDGSTRLLGGQQYLAECDWHPSGQKLAYASVSQDSYQLRSVDLEGNDTLLSDSMAGQARDTNPQWSPNGETVVFERHHLSYPVAQLWTVDTRTGQEKKLFYATSDVQDPTYAADGQSLVFTSNHNGPDYDLYSLDLSNLEVTQLTDLPGNEHSPSFSPDGKTLAFVHSDGKEHEVKFLETEPRGVTAEGAELDLRDRR